MSRKQRLRVCGNLMQLMCCVQSPAARRMYKRQLERTAARLKGGDTAS
jgi:hypothetical protein